MTIAITGATGEVGRRVSALVEAPRLIVRNPSRAPAGADTRVASDYGAFDEMRDALTGADTVFLIPAGESADRVDRHKAAVDAAVAAGVTRLIYLSFFNAAPDATFTLARDHWHTEEHIRAAGVRWTFLRMNLYIDFIPSMVPSDGVLRGPAGDGRVAAILRDDVAASAAAVLSSGDHDGRTYDLTGPESFSFAEAAALMTQLTDKAVRYEDESDEDAFASRAHFGAPDFEVRGWVSTYQAVRDGSLTPVSTGVRDLTGREPVALADYLKAHPDALSHVGAPGA